MFIHSVGTAVPAWCYEQAEGWEVLQATEQFGKLTLRSRGLIKRVLQGDNGINTRHLSISDLREVFVLEPDVLHARFAEHGPALATEAARRALVNAGVRAEEIDAIIISTCTGYLCPGLTSYVSERLGLRADILPVDLVGQGCGAALPNLRLGEALLAGGKAKRVLSICVEICSAAFYLDDDVGVLISACLFGDGAGAVVLGNDPPAVGRSIRWVAAESQLNPADRDSLRFELKDGMLRNILTKQVPEMAARAVEGVLVRLLGQAQVGRDQIAGWILHAGGRDVLMAIGNRLGLGAAELSLCADVLRRYGNVSSPSVFFVLERAMQMKAQGGKWFMSAFGAGFSCHGALLEAGRP